MKTAMSVAPILVRVGGIMLITLGVLFWIGMAQAVTIGEA